MSGGQEIDHAQDGDEGDGEQERVASIARLAPGEDLSRLARVEQHGSGQQDHAQGQGNLVLQRQLTPDEEQGQTNDQRGGPNQSNVRCVFSQLVEHSIATSSPLQPSW